MCTAVDVGLQMNITSEMDHATVRLDKPLTLAPMNCVQDCNLCGTEPI